jgi:hypothetical protein
MAGDLLASLLVADGLEAAIAAPKIQEQQWRALKKAGNPSIGKKAA